MIVFLDTEFTDLLDPQLLSIGMVSLAGREYYVELDLTTDEGKARERACGEFARGDVLELWGLVNGAAGTWWEMGRRTGDWLLHLAGEDGGCVEVAYDTAPTTSFWKTACETLVCGSVYKRWCGR